ncbi:MAG: N-acetylmuramoyl-L-alanine amidase family protein [Acidimicrobiales bacterium]
MTVRRVAVALCAVALTGSCRADGDSGVVSAPMLTTAGQPAAAAPPAPSPPPTATSDTGAGDGPGVVMTPSGVVLPVLSETDGGWTVRTPCGEERTVTTGTHVRHVDIVLDPGHGGFEKGAVSPGGLAEAGVNLAVARRAQADLEAEGISVVLTRTGDYDMGLTPRALVGTALDPAALVSIHHNADPDGPRSTPGSETYYQQSSADSRRLAGLVQEEVVRALSAYRIDWVSDTDAGAKIREGARGDYYAMLRQTAPVVSVLAELAFISNQVEADLIARADVQAAEGAAVARAAVRYLRTSDPGSGFTEAYPRGPDPGGPPGPPAPACVDPAFDCPLAEPSSFRSGFAVPGAL